MAIVTLIIKIMPDSPSTDLHAIQSHARQLLEKEGAKNLSFEEKPIAFGLKAVMVKFDLPEEKGTETAENKLGTIPHVSSVTIEDYRRAFG
ncbi:elongation factor 1-beta [Candidatus Pacearchaeota archaeon]|nr:elongation factor 1-beta [Candidatus Pacearchaeota archaeon]